MSTLIVEFNSQFVDLEPRVGWHVDGRLVVVAMTPPIDGEYWWARVKVSERQAIVGFPKFMTIGVGFQHEDDWNTNLPYVFPADEIFDHISHNKGDVLIPDDRCVKAIEMLQKAIHDHKLLERMYAG